MSIIVLELAEFNCRSFSLIRSDGLTCALASCKLLENFLNVRRVEANYLRKINPNPYNPIRARFQGPLRNLSKGHRVNFFY